MPSNYYVFLNKLNQSKKNYFFDFSDAKYIQRKIRRRNQIQREKRREYEIQHSKRPKSKIPSVSSSLPKVKKQQSRRPPPLQIPNRTNAPPLSNRKHPSRY